MSGLVLTVNKDANGYGMKVSEQSAGCFFLEFRSSNFVCPFPKVSGDKPVFVESVKPGGAAQKAGLMAEDMILKVGILIFFLYF